MRERTPNFFIVGAPRCGTTSMYRYLAAHPEVFMSRVKEPHFFGRDLYDPGHVVDESTYLELFENVQDERAIGEASVWYLYSTSAASEIHQFCPKAKIIVLLRNPLEMLPSLHRHHIFTGYQAKVDFITEFNNQIDLRSSKGVSRSSSFRMDIDYLEVAAFSTQLHRYLKHFPPEQIKIIFFEDFVDSTAEVFASTLEFLGVDSQFRPNFTRHNAGRERRFHFAAPKPAKRRNISRKSRLSVMRPLYRPIGKALRSWNIRQADNKPLSPLPPEFFQSLTPEIKELERITQRSLEHWLTQ